MLRSGKSQTCVYLSGEKELISIDEDVTATLQIMKEIIENEEIDWRKNIFTKISKGYSDASIMVNSPIGRTKYYDAKKEFIDKIYQCCIFKGLVDYKDILGRKTG